MLKALVIIAVIIAGIYFGITAALPHLNNSNFENAVGQIIEEIDGIEALTMNENIIRSKVIEAGRWVDIPLEEEDVYVTWERDGNEMLVAVDLDVTYVYKFLSVETDLSIHREATIAINVEEEQKRAEEERVKREQTRAAEMAEEEEWKQKCDKLGGVYDGNFCNKGVMKYEKWYF